MMNKELVNNGQKLINKLIEEKAYSDNKSMKWLYNNCQNEALKKVIPNLTILMVHVLDSIYKNGPINCMSISFDTDVLKGTVSKIAKKMVEYNLLRVEFLENNKKEKLYVVTDLGRELGLLHEALHQEIEKKLFNHLSKFNEEEIGIFIDIIKEYMAFDVNDEEKE